MKTEDIYSDDKQAAESYNATEPEFDADREAKLRTG